MFFLLTLRGRDDLVDVALLPCRSCLSRARSSAAVPARDRERALEHDAHLQVDAPSAATAAASGVSSAAAIEEGFRRAWPSIRDSNISTILTSIILYYFMTGFVRGFALTLLLGVIVSMFSAISVTRTILKVFVQNPKL